jgi:hypothetical protein
MTSRKEDTMTPLLRLLHTRRPRDDRGDVPGWVMVTVMSAGLCAALYGIAHDQLDNLLTGALSSVTK